MTCPPSTFEILFCCFFRFSPKKAKILPKGSLCQLTNLVTNFVGTAYKNTKSTTVLNEFGLKVNKLWPVHFEKTTRGLWTSSTEDSGNSGRLQNFASEEIFVWVHPKRVSSAPGTSSAASSTNWKPLDEPNSREGKIGMFSWFCRELSVGSFKQVKLKKWK